MACCLACEGGGAWRGRRGEGKARAYTVADSDEIGYVNHGLRVEHAIVGVVGLLVLRRHGRSWTRSRPGAVGKGLRLELLDLLQRHLLVLLLLRGRDGRDSFVFVLLRAGHDRCGCGAVRCCAGVACCASLLCSAVL